MNADNFPVDLLHPLRTVAPRPGSIHRWQQAVLSELTPHRADTPFRRTVKQIALALFAFALGAATRFLATDAKGNQYQAIPEIISLPIAENSIQDATYQHIFVKGS